jgi:hypothetical protein
MLTFCYADRKRLTVSEFIPNSVQVPNVVFDELMSQLDGAQFKCLCLVIRQTRSWSRDVEGVRCRDFQPYVGGDIGEIVEALESLVDSGLLVEFGGVFSLSQVFAAVGGE